MRQIQSIRRSSVKPHRLPIAAIAVILFITCLAFSNDAAAQHTHGTPNNKSSQKASAKKTGILLMAHGGRQGWNAEVNKLASEIDKSIPVEVAFGMASKRTIQGALDRLVARGASEIVAVPLFISSHSSVVTSTEYLLGQRSTAPADLAIFSRMDHSHGGAGNHASTDPSFDPTTPVKASVPIRMTGALNRHPLVADILLSRAKELSKEPEKEVVILVAHGPVTDDNNAKWLADMGALAERMRAASKYKRIEYLTVRDDAKDPVRAQATAELRQTVERAMAEGSRVLIVPLLLSYGGIEEGIRKRLDGLTYVMSSQGLLPDERLGEWVRLSVRQDR